MFDGKVYICTSFDDSPLLLYIHDWHPNQITALMIWSMLFGYKKTRYCVGKSQNIPIFELNNASFLIVKRKNSTLFLLLFPVDSLHISVAGETK